MPKAPEPSSTCQNTTKSLPRISPKSYRHNAVPNRFSSRFSTSRTNGPRSLSRRKRVHTRLHSKNRTQRLTRRNRGCFGWGRYLYPLTVLRGPETLRGQVSERQTLPLLRLDPVCSRRTQKAFGTAMRLCASLFRRRRGPAGPRCSVCNLVMLLFFHFARRAFRTCEKGGGITTLGALCVLLKCRTAACQSG